MSSPNERLKKEEIVTQFMTSITDIQGIPVLGIPDAISVVHPIAFDPFTNILYLKLDTEKNVEILIDICKGLLEAYDKVNPFRENRVEISNLTNAEMYIERRKKYREKNDENSSYDVTPFQEFGNDKMLNRYKH